MTNEIGPFSDRGARYLASLVHSLRPSWDEPGVLAAFAKRGAANPGRLALAALTAAVDQANRTPAVIALDGPHWRVGTDTVQSPADTHPSAIAYRDLCDVCHKPEHAHPWTGCDTYRRPTRDGAPPPAWLGELRATLHDTPPTAPVSGGQDTARVLDRAAAAGLSQARTALRSDA